MIPSSTYIDQTLFTLNRIFKRCDALVSDNNMVCLVAKLAFIEFCGWLECSLDEVYKELANKIRNNDSKSNALNNIQNTSAFKRPKFESVIGLVGIRVIETELAKLSQADQVVFEQFMGTLSRDLQDQRNIHVHNHIVAISPNRLKSPSETIELCNKIKAGFVVLDKLLRNAGLI